MTDAFTTRRTLLAASGTLVATTVCGLILPARAQGVAPTPSMRGGSNNYLPGAPIVERIGGGGFWMTGTVRRAGDGAPLADQRIQIWAHTTEGNERDPWSHGATLTDANGEFRLEMPQIVPASVPMGIERLGLRRSPDRPTPAVIPVKAGKIMAKTVKKLNTSTGGCAGVVERLGSEGLSFGTFGLG